VNKNGISESLLLLIILLKIKLLIDLKPSVRSLIPRIFQ